ncbi:MAG: 16S rRNA (adenine(1518)-N(6)/adenine(1519)-N(6))-dimethyltransferase RsmA [Pseudomonadota bacterium]
MTDIAPDALGPLHPAATPADLPPLREVIRALDLRASKAFSQNFILDLNLTGRIARSDGSLEGRTVIEIGPGPGGLTRALLGDGAAHVLAIEKDPRCAPALAQIMSAHPPGRLRAVQADALTFDYEANLPDTAKDVTIAANLPYAIATRLLTLWLDIEPWPPWFASMILMFQREVADRIVAEPGTKAYGRLAVLSQWRCHVAREIELKPEAFTPPPKVSSSVVVFHPKRDHDDRCSATALARVTAAAFGQRRKMLRQSLKQLTPMPELLLDKAGIAPEARAETLTVTDFVTLAEALGSSTE